MKKLVIACLLMFGVLAVSAVAEEMKGLITCAKCRHTDEKAQTCANTCVKSGVKPIFYSSADQKFYTITNPAKAKNHVGHEVTVTGKVEGDNLTIEKLTMAGGAAKGKKKAS